MLALLLGLVLAYELCDQVPSCTLQVNGTLPKAAIIATLPNGGAGHTFTTTDCIRGLIGITEPCQCQNDTMWSSPGFCYFSGNYSQHSSGDSTHFCKNQNGMNTFSMWNSSASGGWPWNCHCFDPTTGNKNVANFVRPVCKDGQAEHVPCSTDGKNDNAALLAKYTGKEQAALVTMGIPRRDHFRTCQCGGHTCAINEDRQYCQSEQEYCADVPSCDEGKVFEPTDNFQKECLCGYHHCAVGDKCQTKVIDGIKKYVCTLNGGSSSAVFLIKRFHGAMGLVTIFSIIAFVCLIGTIVFWILTCLKVKRAAQLASTNLEGQ